MTARIGRPPSRRSVVTLCVRFAGMTSTQGSKRSGGRARSWPTGAATSAGVSASSRVAGARDAAVAAAECRNVRRETAMGSILREPVDPSEYGPRFSPGECGHCMDCRTFSYFRPPTMNDPLDTGRARLRAVRPGDEDAIHRLLSDERVIRYMLFPSFTAERARTFVARLQEAGASGQPNQIVFGIEWPSGTSSASGSTTELVGLCGLVLRPEQEEGEVWYLLLRIHGQWRDAFLYAMLSTE